MATIKDVARLAGVGVGTASRVLSGKGSTSADARARVEEAIRTLNFRPSKTARALSLRSTGTIGVFVPDFKGPFYGPMLHAIDTELRRHDRHMVAANGCGHEDARQQALDGLQFLIERECDAIVVTSNALRDADYTELHGRYPRVAVVNRKVRGMGDHCFTVDHKRGGVLAAQALLAQGHRAIAVISGPHSAPDNRQRLAGFHEELARHGIASEQVATEDADFTAASGWAATERLIQRGARFTGLFCANDQMAMAAMSCLQASGRSVPGQVSVVGYDDAEIASFLSPRLSSVRIAIGDMALNACRLLLNLSYGSELPVTYRFEPELQLRESIGPAPR
ncbi:LacI family DNA-binding transcriptional regulator [Aquabacterium sp. A7-Y]|uniref:LacI family DNA-binding transcriptional regulator n=1 Tax=Aquabacterium sp. A7-Y TaxID=1349605 RepID=UPI00223DD606|nr:LacI family DNA-binding transcriptional regulator [Aquabacterium sp. A7-Y]MCW7537926.1 LacI family DNA-binding transcriptional regulator [Aquabacterium sp. A7-Y]